MSAPGAQVFIDRNRTIAPTSPLLFSGFAIDKAWQLTGDDPKAVYTWEVPGRIDAQPTPEPAVDERRASVSLPPLLFTVLTTRAG